MRETGPNPDQNRKLKEMPAGREVWKIEEEKDGEEEEKRVEENEEEYELEDVRDRIKSSRGSRFNLMTNELGLESTRRKFSRESLLLGLRDLSQGLVIHPDNRYHHHYSLSHLFYLFLY
jgi:hypothetical protein